MKSFKTDNIIIKILLLVILLMSFIFVCSEESYAQLDFSLEINFGYDIMFPQSTIKTTYQNPADLEAPIEVFTPNEYSFNQTYLYFPFGLTIAFTTTKKLQLTIDILFENREFTRHTVINDLEENFTIKLELLTLPINLRVYLPLNIFLMFGCSMSFPIRHEFSGTMFQYTNSPHVPPTESDITIFNFDDEYYGIIEEEIIHLYDIYQDVDFCVHFGIGWKFYFNEVLYFIAQVRGSFSVLDIDKSFMYETFIYSIIPIIGVGADLG